MYPAAAAITAPETELIPAFQLFRRAVARAQLTAWLPRGRHTIVDVSGPNGPGAELAAAAGHTVLRVREDRAPAAPVRRDGPNGPVIPRPGNGAGAPVIPRPRSDGDAGTGLGRPADADAGAGPGRPADADAGAGPRRLGGKNTPPGTIASVTADPSRLAFLRDGCADEVIAEDRVLSTQLAAEAMVAEIARVLRPGGRVLACVDSLVFGMSVLAGQHHWAHLVDLPRAEVVLVPWPDGTITRCYGPDQADELFGGAGLAVTSIRPRTMLCESVVTPVLRRTPRSLARLVRAELTVAADDSLGTELVISARKRG